MAERVSVKHRVEAIDQLDQLARYLNTMSAWLGERGLETEADAMTSPRRTAWPPAGGCPGRCAAAPSAALAAARRRPADGPERAGWRIFAGQRAALPDVGHLAALEVHDELVLVQPADLAGGRSLPVGRQAGRGFPPVTPVTPPATCSTSNICSGPARRCLPDQGAPAAP